MANRGKSNTLFVLAIFLLLVTSIVFGSLYIDSAQKNKLLKLDVKRLEGSQVLLMVPDEQAADIASWMASHPQKAQDFVKKAKSGQAQSVVINNTSQEKNKPDKQTAELTDAANKRTGKTFVLSENEDGVKVIHLPHGGIRVTTREQ